MKKLQLLALLMALSVSVMSQEYVEKSEMKRLDSVVKTREMRAKPRRVLVADAVTALSESLPTRTEGDIIYTTVLTEDFSKFVAGEEDLPDENCLVSAGIEGGEVPEEYTQTPGWLAQEIYQAGGVCYLGEFETTNSEGDTSLRSAMLISPDIKQVGSGWIVTLKARCESGLGNVLNIEVYQKVGDNRYEYIDWATADISDSWSEVRFEVGSFSSDAYFTLFGNSGSEGVYLDDIKVEAVTVPVPTGISASNVTEDSFTLSWNEVEGATNYGVLANMTHIAKQDEVYNIVNATFDEVVDGTMDSPCDYTWDEYLNYDVESLFGIIGSYADGWDCYANGVFGLNGTDSDGWEYYANFVSGDLDLSANGGAGTIELDVCAPLDHMFKVELYRMNGAWERILYKDFYGTDNWEHLVIDFADANERCYVYIQYFRNGHMFIDNFKIRQNLKVGDEVVKTISNQNLYGETSTTIDIPKCCENDKITYQVNASLWYYTTSGSYSWPHTAIFGEYSEIYTLDKSSSLRSIDRIVGGAEVVGGRLKIDADAEDNVCVYSVSGALVYSGNVSNANGLLLPSGMYVISIGDNVYKIVSH